MKKHLLAFVAPIAILTLGLSAAKADTIVSATEMHYDPAYRMDCLAVRMNTSTFGNAPANACSLDTQGSNGPDRITKTTYDPMNRVLEVDQAVGTSNQRAYARYTYTVTGQKATEKDANGNLTAYNYDGYYRLSQIQYPSKTTGSGNPDATDYELFQYDSNNNKTTWQRRNGKTLYYNYDALNREILRYVSDGSVPNVYSDYNLQGQLCIAAYSADVHASGPDCTSLFSSLASTQGVHYAYDGLGRILSAEDMNGRTITYQYDMASNRTRLTYPDGNWQPYTYDADNRVTLTSLGAGSVSITYDNLGRPSLLGKGAASTAYGYDNLGRLTSMGNSVATSGDSTSWGFSYTPASQISSWSASTTAFDYVETANATVNSTYDGLNRDAGIAALSGGYDANGNLTYDGTRTFTYDIYNHLLTATGGSANLSLVYDPLGRLASQTSNGVVTTFLYDGTNLISEYNSSGAVTQRYVFGPGADRPLIWDQGSQNSNPYYFIEDYHGSVIGYVDASGNLQSLYKYGPFGEPKDANNATNFTGARFRYTGQTVIPEASLYYYKARVYDPIFGRFLQTDPIGSKDDLDLYAYTSDDPVNESDSAGTEADIEKQKENITIVVWVKFSGDKNANTEENQQKFISAVQGAWSGQFGKYNVTTQVFVSSSAPNTVSLNSSGATLTSPLTTTINFNVNDNNFRGKFDQHLEDQNMAHEFGHMIGLHDHYHESLGSYMNALSGNTAARHSDPDKGYENNIMGNPWGTHKDERNIDESMKSSFNSVNGQ